jgi:1,4-dihydroxy-2-naphthoate octaprenyltransferase
VVRLAPARARWGYLLIALVAHAWLVAAVFARALPWPALAALVSLIPALVAARGLLRHAAEPSRLEPAIRATIGAASLHGALLAAGLVTARWLA